MAQGTMIEARQVGKQFDGKTILENVTFQVPKGKVVGLLGPNGSGKTTIVRLLNGVITAETGEITVGGMDPRTEGNAIRRMSGVVTEGAGLYPDMSAAENLAFFADLYGVKQATKRVDELLEQFRLTAVRDQRVGSYSTGMKRRAALAKALLHAPELLFLDEPTNGLDPDGIKDVIGFLQELNRTQGTTILLCSHVLHQLENICSEYLFLDKGRLIEQGTREELERRYRGTVQLRVETGLAAAGEFLGYPVEQVDRGALLFTLPSKDAITGLLQAIANESWIHSAERVNRDLESLYFEVRGKLL
jgi:ABC-2 type transport system ATP-binding protein